MTPTRGGARGTARRGLIGGLLMGCGLGAILGGAAPGGRAWIHRIADAPAYAAESQPTAEPGHQKLDLPPRTWVARPAPTLGQGPYPEGFGKIGRMLFDSKRGRIVLAAGNYHYAEPGVDATERYSGMHLVWAIDLSQGEHAKWTRLTPWCAPQGGVQPGRPGTVVWVYDAKRDQGVMMPGFYFNSQNDPPPTNCPGVTQTLDSVVFDFATTTWSLPPYGPPPGKMGYGGDEGSSYGVYDPVTDAVYRFRRIGYTSIEILYRATNRWEQIPLGAEGTGVGETRPNRDQPAIDVKGRNIYVISRKMRAVLRYSIPAKRVTEAIPLPPEWVPPRGPDLEGWMTFDPVNRVLLNPVTRDYFGVLVGLAIYHVDTNLWEWEHPPPRSPAVSGNVVGFDATNNCLIFLGRSTTKVWWLYRYGPGESGAGAQAPR